MRIFALLWLLFITSCTGPSIKQEREADVKAVLQQAFTHEELVRFLSRSRQGYRIFLFRYEELPIYNGYHMSKPTFDISIPNQHPIRYNTRLKDELNNVVVIIERITIDHDSATMNLRIPKQGVFGEFRLSKNQAGDWHVTNASVVET